MPVFSLPAGKTRHTTVYSSFKGVDFSSDTTKIDNARYKARFGAKAKMLTPEQAVELIGHAVGGVCPFAVNDGVEVYLDESLKRFQTVFPACGSSNSEIKLTIPELEQCSNSLAWVDVCKGWQ